MQEPGSAIETVIINSKYNKDRISAWVTEFLNVTWFRRNICTCHAVYNYHFCLVRPGFCLSRLLSSAIVFLSLR